MEPAAAKQATRAKTEKKKAAAADQPDVKKAYVPPPPPDGPKIPAPVGMPAIKTFPISSGPQPKGMTIPGVAAAAAEEKKPAPGGDA